MSWKVVFHGEFDPEFEEFPAAVQDALYLQLVWIRQFGPTAGRPRVDTLKASRFPNMKELRFDAADGVWRVAFAFDPKQQAVLLVAGDKSGVSEKKFYKSLIEKADRRFAQQLDALKVTKGKVQ
jgi:hypothetical protein